MKTLRTAHSWLLSPGIYNLPRLLSLSTLIISFFSLLLNWALPETLRPSVPALFRVAPSIALTFLLLSLSMRLTRWEKFDARTAHRAKFSRVLAGVAALLSVFDSAPILLAAGQSILAATLILLAYGRFLFARRVLLIVSLIIGTWLVLANLYSVHRYISYELTADPSSAFVMLAITLSLCLMESRTGLIPSAFTSVLGRSTSVQLLLAALLLPIVIGYARLQLENSFHLNSNLLLALHVMATLFAMAALLFASMSKAKEKLDDQLRLQSDLESAESSLLALLAQGSEFYLTMNLAGRLLSANENAKRYLGLPDLSKSVICIEDVILDESHEKMRKLPEALLRGMSQNAVLLFKLSAGDSMPLYITAACRMRNGAALEIVLVGRSLPLGLRSPEASKALLVSA